MDILQEILRYKKESLTQAKSDLPLRELKARISNTPHPASFKMAVKRGKDKSINLIAEIKGASPSRGVIREEFNLLDIAKIYDEKNAAAISVLTEEHFFQGKLDYLKEVRKVTRKPLLRKDFIFDEYQVYESRVSGADAILLIIACLDKYQLNDFLGLAKELSLDSLVEVHNLKELDTALKSGAEIVGINNRNLKTLKVDLNTTFELIKDIPPDRIIVSESGIKTREDVKRLELDRVDAMLVGTAIIKEKDIGAKIDELLDK